jgi:hypothetical protein
MYTSPLFCDLPRFWRDVTFLQKRGVGGGVCVCEGGGECVWVVLDLSQTRTGYYRPCSGNDKSLRNDNRHIFRSCTAFYVLRNVRSREKNFNSGNEHCESSFRKFCLAWNCAWISLWVR